LSNLKGATNILEIQNINKSFPGVQALKIVIPQSLIPVASPKKVPKS